MDNDVLINQARQLYANLCVRQGVSCNENKFKLERLLISAYDRYQRRLNRCVLCYRYRTYDCLREAGKKSISCVTRKQFNHIAVTFDPAFTY